MQVEAWQENHNQQTAIQVQKHIFEPDLKRFIRSAKSEEQYEILQNSNSGSSQKSQKSQRQITIDSDNILEYLSLTNIKSKQEIELQSKQNQQILLNLNSNIDDLFKKISSLTQQINTQIQPRQLKQKPVSNNEQHNKIDEKIQKPQMLCKSSPYIDFKQPLKLVEKNKQYRPIFFQLNHKKVQQFSINMKLFQTGTSLGCGKFGQVVQCRNTKTNYLYALKKIFKSVIDEYRMEAQLLTELKILTQIDHPNIVKAYEAFTDDFHIFIVMQFIHGSLLTNKFKSPEKQVKVIIRQVLHAIKYLHDRNIAHRDIKPQNIILTRQNVVKICDFGWAEQQRDKMNILCGTLDYVSPQMVKQQCYSQKVDLWNVGVLTYELVYGYPPFKGSSKNKMFQRVKNLEYSFSDEVQIGQSCRSFISGFLKNEEQRQTIQQALEHQFLSDISSNAQDQIFTANPQLEAEVQNIFLQEI